MAEFHRQIFSDLADLFGYPGQTDIIQKVSEILNQHNHLDTTCHRELERFRDSISGQNVDNLEGLYIGTFDLGSETCPYVGFLVFGDSCKRGEFLVGLKKMYKEQGFEAGSELPDHIAVILRFAAHVGTENPEVIDLARYACLPALEKAIRAIENNPCPNPYLHLMKTVVALLYTIDQTACQVEEART